MLERDSIVSMVHASESKAHHCNGSFDFDIFLGEGEAQKQERERRKNGAVLCRCCP